MISILKRFCPCGVPGFWNASWYDSVHHLPYHSPIFIFDCLQIIRISTITSAPRHVLSLHTLLQPPVHGIGGIGLSLFLHKNLSLVQDAYSTNTFVLRSAIMSDGVKADGVFAAQGPFILAVLLCLHACR
jgi:hypothetical protein